jgi:hypothetical protein
MIMVIPQGQSDKEKDADRSEQTKKLTTLLTNRINLLLVDDDYPILHSLCGLFSSSSPLFCVTTASSFEEAERAIKCQKGNWHAWVIDIDLGTKRSGFDILKTNPNFPFTAVLSGLHSMSLGSEASKCGAMWVFDKGAGFFEKMYGDLCDIAALGFILRGRSTKYLPIFSILQDISIRTSQEWADRAHVTFRQLARVCENQGKLHSRHYIAFYNVCRYLLTEHQPRKHCLASDRIDNDCEKFISDCIDYALRHTREIEKLINL